ncbi:hypothetical protein [Actinomycetospora soli]|uniref:hypothetical protein n=1 Tax=Actinomycetospora soli TaxID=2893887 RepID=UPI001E35FD16|nr:hypothetical protein [Actinomycetospora soli]MCD2186224.1 hypothetical protein [Actinomycetospora soli]
MPAPFACYLRVYEPLGALPGPLAQRVRAGLARGAIPVTRVGARERDVCLRAQLGVPVRLLPGERVDGTATEGPVDVLLADGADAPAAEEGSPAPARFGPTTMVCPLDTRPRAAAALVGFLSTESPVLRTAALNHEESTVRSRAEAVVAELGEGATHIVSATWTVPLPWFVLVEAADRVLVLAHDDAATADGPGLRRRCYWRVSMADALARADSAAELLSSTLGDGGPAEVLRDTARWLRHFDAGSLVELDYGGLVQLVDDETLAGDTSAEDVAAALDALREGDAEKAMESYRRLRDFWASRAIRERAN